MTDRQDPAREDPVDEAVAALDAAVEQLRRALADRRREQPPQEGT